MCTCSGTFSGNDTTAVLRKRRFETPRPSGSLLPAGAAIEAGLGQVSSGSCPAGERDLHRYRGPYRVRLSGVTVRDSRPGRPPAQGELEARSETDSPLVVEFSLQANKGSRASLGGLTDHRLDWP